MRPVALVTGASRRLGRAFAEGAARAGHDVAVHYRSDPAAAARDGRRRSARSGARAEAFRGRPPGAGRAPEGSWRRSSAASAGSTSSSTPPPPGSRSRWRTSPRPTGTPSSRSARAPRSSSRRRRPRRSPRRQGSILLVSDVAATKAWPHHVPHAAAKAAVDALVRNLAVALAPAVRVNGVAPGIVLPPDDLPAAEVAKLVARTPLKRPVPVEDLVSAALLLAANRSITGQVLAVDAGRSVV